MRKLIVILFLLATTASFGQNEVCRYKMVAPVANETLVFSDSLLKINFNITQTAIGFTLCNITSNSLSILWDECSVSPGVTASKVIHNGIALDNTEQPQPSTRIPPGGTIQDFVIPVSKIYSGLYDSGKRILPIAIPYIGSDISFFMVLKSNGKEVEYNFKFLVTEVLK